MMWHHLIRSMVFSVSVVLHRSTKSKTGVVALLVALLAAVRWHASIIRFWLRRTPRWLVTLLVEYTARFPGLNKDSARATFNAEPLIVGKPVPNHTHGYAAAARSGANALMRRFASVLGKDAFYYQMSLSDQRRRQMGNREFFWAKDVAAAPRWGNPAVAQVLGIVDVDYYLDMDQFASEQPLVPMLLYTIVPSAAAALRKDYSYTFDTEQKIHMVINGGADYRHRLWDWSGDTVTLRSDYGLFNTTLTIYELDRRQVDEDHQLILLNPTSRWTGVAGAIVAECLEHHWLKRLHLVENGWTVIQSRGPQGHVVSIAKAGEHNCATLPVEKNDAIATVARNSKLDLSMYTVESYSGLPREQAALLTEYHRLKMPRKAPFVYPVDSGIRRVQFNPAQYEPEAKPLMKPYMSAIVPNCYVHDATKANEERAVAGRVTEVLQDVDADGKLLDYMDEFVRLLVPEPHQGVPVDTDEIHERQNRPSQRIILEEGEWFGSLCKWAEVVRTFLKKEPYQKVTDPRIISTIHGCEKVRYSAYTYALSNHMKSVDWYAFGRSPREISARVAALCKLALVSGTKSDAKRWDGHLSQAMRRLEKMVHTRYFREVYTSEIVELHRTQFSKVAMTTEGVRYETHFARLSGSPETSLFNSIGGAFIAYLGFRTWKRPVGSFLNATEAWAALGIYGGDDGFTTDLPAKELIRAGKMVGQELEAVDVSRGDVGVAFLARSYSPEVWYGDDNSICDIKRQLSKIHVTVALSAVVSPQEKLLEKSRGYFLTDRLTPVIGDFCTAVVLASEGTFVDPDGYDKMQPSTEILTHAQQRLVATGAHEEIRSYFGFYPSEDQFPNAVGDWAGFEFRKQLPEADWHGFRGWLKQAILASRDIYTRAGNTPLYDHLVPFLHPVPLVEIEAPKATVPAIVDGALVAPPSPEKRRPRRRSRPDNGAETSAQGAERLRGRPRQGPKRGGPSKATVGSGDPKHQASQRKRAGKLA